MLVNTDYIAPAELTGYARAALQDLQANQCTLSRWLPVREIDDLMYRFTRGGEGLAEAATFRAYDAESPIGARPGVNRVTGELPPISRKIRLGEYDRLRQRSAPGEITNGIEADTARMTRAVAARIELARGQALYTGMVTIAENGVEATADFGRAGGHTVSAATPWSTVATATPVADMMTWAATYETTNGVAPGVILTSTRVIQYLMRNAEVRVLLGSVAGTPSIVSRDALSSTLSAYGLPPIVAYNVQVRAEQTNGTVATVKVIPDDRVLFLPADGAELGATLFGTTAESLEPEFGIAAGEAPGIVAGAYSTKDPVAVWTKAAAIALPVLANPDLTFAADVA